MADLKGLTYRVPGIAGAVYKELGMSVVILPGAEIVPAAERGVIDATAWAVPAEDISLGIHDIWKTYHTPGMHEPTTTCELQLSKAVWDNTSNYGTSSPRRKRTMTPSSRKSLPPRSNSPRR